MLTGPQEQGEGRPEQQDKDAVSGAVTPRGFFPAYVTGKPQKQRRNILSQSLHPVSEKLGSDVCDTLKAVSSEFCLCAHWLRHGASSWAPPQASPSVNVKVHRALCRGECWPYLCWPWFGHLENGQVLTRGTEGIAGGVWLRPSVRAGVLRWALNPQRCQGRLHVHPQGE